MTTSAHPFPASTFRLLPSSRLSAPVSRRFIFLHLQFPLLSRRSLSVLDTQLSVLPFSPPPVPPPSGFPSAPMSPFDSIRFSPSTLSGFPYSPSRSAYSACCLFPFVLPCFAPTAVPQVLTFRSRSGVLHSSGILSSALALGSSLLSLCSAFPHSVRSASQWLPVQAPVPFVPVASPLHPRLVSRPLLPVPLTWLPVCFLSSYPASLPQPFRRWSPFALAPALSMAPTFFRPSAL